MAYRDYPLMPTLHDGYRSLTLTLYYHPFCQLLFIGLIHPNFLPIVAYLMRIGLLMKRIEKVYWVIVSFTLTLSFLGRLGNNVRYQCPLGNGMGNPAGIASATRTRPVAQPYPQPHGFTRQRESKNVQIGPELKEIQPILMNFAKSAVTSSVLVQKLCFWTRLKTHG